MSKEEFHRKLTAILSADVAGYSRLMGDDEAATVKTLETYKGVMFSLIRQHRGRVVDSPGDNLLADFGSVVDAVQCGVSIQKELQTRNADLPETRKMAFRIGINLGDVIEEEDRIYGDGVNIAARLEALADPGGICVSKTAFDHIESKLPLGYEFLGDQTVKNIAKPVGAYKVLMETRVVDATAKREAEPASFWWKKSVLSFGVIVILAIVVVLYWNFYPREASIDSASIEPEQIPVVVDMEEAPKTIAVLPFENLSSDPEQEYFVDGLSEELLNCLAKISGLRVTSRTSSFAFKDTSKTLQEVASVLGVDHILEGSVRKAGDKLRITAQLIRVKDDSHLWSETYDRELKDIFDLQEEIATAVAEELKVTLGVGKSFKQLGGTDNLEAYELYLISKGHFQKDIGDVLKSIDAAIALDPEFALAWSFKADMHNAMSMFVPINRVASEVDKVGLAAQMAVELEPNLAEAYVSLGSYRAVKGEWIEAELAYRKAIELSSGSSLDMRHYNKYLLSVGYLQRGLENIEETFRSDPLNQEARGFYIMTLGGLGDMRRVDEEYKRGRELFGETWISNDYYVTMARLSSGNVVTRDDIVSTSLIDDVAKEHLDSPKVALAELHSIYLKNRDLTLVQLLQISGWAAYFGDPDLALDAEEKCLKLNNLNAGTFWIPVMKQVRRLPRFKELVKEIGLIDYWEKFGWPDICRPLDNGDFECD